MAVLVLPSGEYACYDASEIVFIDSNDQIPRFILSLLLSIKTLEVDMEALKIVLFTLTLCLAVLAVVFGAARVWIRRLRDRAIVALREDTAGEHVYHVADCNFFGILSSGLAQMRGNGLLALTSGGIRFRMLTPARALFIPRASIRGVSHPRWFLKKSKARELLRVDFTGDGGEEDAAAWLVRDLRWWDEAITALGASEEPPPH